jgi:hypothetical protein
LMGSTVPTTNRATKARIATHSGPIGPPRDDAGDGSHSLDQWPSQ